MLRFKAATLGVLIVFVLLEILIRLLGLFSVSSINAMENPAEYIDGAKNISISEGYGVRVGNRVGALDRELVDDDNLDERILLFGDSYSEAIQVENDSVYDNIFEDLFIEQNKAVEVVNFGRSGHSTVDEFDYYIHYADRIKHDKIFIQFSMNDFNDNLNSTLVYNKKTRTFNKNRWKDCNKGMVNGLIYFGRSYSVVFNLLATRLFEYKELILDWMKGSSEASEKQITPSVEELIATESILKEMNNYAIENGAKMYVFQIPDFNRDKFDQSQFIKKICVKCGIRYLDVSGEFAQMNHKQEAVYNGFINTKFRNGHMNAKGHRLIGEILFNLIRGE